MSRPDADPDAAAGPPSRGPAAWLSLIGLVLVAAFAGVAWVQSRSLGLLNETVAYQGDNLVWSFYQLETEALRLRSLADDLADRRSVSPDELRERYEIFVSRISLIEPHRTRQVLPDLPGQAEVLQQLEALVAHADPLLAEDGGARVPDAPVWRDLAQRLEALTGPIRALSLQVNQAVAEQVTRRNDAVRQQSRIAIGLTVFQSLLTLVFAVIVVRQLRALHQRRRHLEQLAQHLQEARAEAEQASRAKSAFLANMSHELRTPFNGLLGMLSLIEASPLDAQQRAHLATARESGLHLLSILNDVLDLSTLESGRLEVSPGPVDLHRLLHDVVALMGGHARAKGLQLRFELAADVPRAVHADGKRLKQILFNLLGNAVKFTAAGEVALQVERLPRREGQAERLRLRVADTGIGMDAATLRQLFQRFSQGDAGIQRRYGGTGLGLEISRSLARLMGGDIEVASQPGAGSRFDVVVALHEMDEVALPAAPALPMADAAAAAAGRLAAGAPVPAPSPEPAGERSGAAVLQVLVTDDHPVNRRLMQAILQRLGHEVHLCENGAEAVAWLREHRCDLVLMDVHMPVMDGLAATRAIRALPAPAGAVPIVALTADAFDAARQRALEAGMNDFMAKPVQVGMVEDLLRRHVPQAAAPARVTPGGAAPLPGESTPTTAAAVPAVPAEAAPAPVAPPPKPARLRLKRGEVGEWLDLEGIAEICVAVGPDGYRSLLAGLLAEPSEALAELLQALQPQAEAAGMRAALHKFKGATASLGLKRLAATARHWEQQAAQGPLAAQPLEELSRLLREEFERSQALCRRLGYLDG
ncbi:MAG: response regulator [Burkholderiaceae bacterium]|nr:response regulator [Burkholderiaceae bacterium]